MEWRDTSIPLTRDEALRIACRYQKTAEHLADYPYHELETARFGRGYAFTANATSGANIYIIVSDEGCASGVFTDKLPTMDAVIAEHLARAAHRNRYLSDDELGVEQRLAIAAHDSGADQVNEASALRIGAIADYADYLLQTMRSGPPTHLSGRELMARTDSLLAPPVAGRRYTHRCPVCGRPVRHTYGYPNAVCEHCVERTTDRTGRQVRGYNTHFSGGMIAYYVDQHGQEAQQQECVEVTRTGVCFIDGREAIMREARLGGIVVEASPGD